MDYFTKRRLVIWGFIVLILLNLSALGTIGFHRFRRVPPRIAHQGLGCMRNNQTHPFIWEKLQLSDEQRSDFKKLRNGFKDRSNIIITELNQKRIDIIEELSQEEPEKEKLDKIASEMGDLHAQLKAESINHLLELKKICTPEQYEMLLIHFNTMFERHGYDGHGRQGGKGKGKRKGHGRNYYAPMHDTID